MPDLESQILAGVLAAYLVLKTAALAIQQLISLVILFKKLKTIPISRDSSDDSKLELPASRKCNAISKVGSRKKPRTRRKRLGSIKKLLSTPDEEAAYVKLKLTLSENLRKTRVNQGLSQKEMAKRLHLTQSRVAKMEVGDSTVSIDLLIRAMLAAQRKEEKHRQAAASE